MTVYHYLSRLILVYECLLAEGFLVQHILAQNGEKHNMLLALVLLLRQVAIAWFPLRCLEAVLEWRKERWWREEH